MHLRVHDIRFAQEEERAARLPFRDKRLTVASYLLDRRRTGSLRRPCGSMEISGNQAREDPPFDLGSMRSLASRVGTVELAA